MSGIHEALTGSIQFERSPALKCEMSPAWSFVLEHSGLSAPVNSGGAVWDQPLPLFLPDDVRDQQAPHRLGPARLRAAPARTDLSRHCQVARRDPRHGAAAGPSHERIMREEFADIFGAADFRLTTVIPTGTRLDIIEGVPA